MSKKADRMKWTHKHIIVTGLVLIVASNVAVLAGVLYNRNGSPESALTLNQRELSLPYRFSDQQENSGLSLTLQWRVLVPEHTSLDKSTRQYSSFSREAGWLTETKMTTLGFTPIPAKSRAANYRSEFGSQLTRGVFLVLELNGPAYETSLARAVQYNDQSEDGVRHLEDERNIHSRLFVVDADLDPAVLRAKYPDRSRYTIMRGQIRQRLQNADGMKGTTGYVSEISVTNLYVPLALKSVIDAPAGGYNNVTESRFRYEVNVAFGQRFEPWITGAARK